MKPCFLLDENLPFALMDFLVKKGFSCEHIKKLGQSGIRNGVVYKLAEENKWWLLSRDADFQNMDKFTRYDVAGIIVIKLLKTRTAYLLEKMEQLFERAGDKFSEKHLILLEDDEIKIY